MTFKECSCFTIFEFFQTFPQGIFLVLQTVSHQLSEEKLRGAGGEPPQKKKPFVLGKISCAQPEPFPAKPLSQGPGSCWKFPWLLCVLGAWGCSPRARITLLCCATCVGVNAGGFPGRNSPRTSASKPPPCPQITVFKKEKKKEEILQGIHLAFVLAGGVFPAEEAPSG